MTQKDIIIEVEKLIKRRRKIEEELKLVLMPEGLRETTTAKRQDS